MWCPAGPDNPLGQFAMRLGVKGSYLIHGTGQEKADGIGMMVTHGCMRMYPEDVAQLFPKVSLGTQVNLVFQSVKVGWRGNVLYVEVSQPLDEDHLGYDKLLAQAMPLIQKKTAGDPEFVLNTEALNQALRKPNGIPQVISGGVAMVETPPLAPRAPSVQTMPPPAPGVPTVTPGAIGAGTAAPAPMPQTLPRPLPPQANPPMYPGSVPVQPTQPAPVAPRPAQAIPTDVPPGPPVTPSSSRPEGQLLPPIY